MNRKIKLIWDFRGPVAQETAEHHAIHLKEYVALEKMNFYEIAEKSISKYAAIAYIIVEEKDILKIRDALKPHRAEVAK